MWKYEKQFRKEKPETIGELDAYCDLDNYKDWLEAKLENILMTLEEVAETIDDSQYSIDSLEFKLWSKCNSSLF